MYSKLVPQTRNRGLHYVSTSYGLCRYLGAGCTSVGLGDAYLLVVYEVNCTHYIVALPGHNACYDKVRTLVAVLYELSLHITLLYDL